MSVSKIPCDKNVSFKTFCLSEDNAIVPPGTESSEQKFENTVTNSNNEGKAERTVIPPKRPYSSGPGQGHRGYLNPYHQNNYRPSGPKKPFDFSRIGGTLTVYARNINKGFCFHKQVLLYCLSQNVNCGIIFTCRGINVH